MTTDSPEIGDTAVCLTCGQPITYLTVTDPGFLPRTGWRDNLPHSLHCGKSIDFQHRPRVEEAR